MPVRLLVTRTAVIVLAVLAAALVGTFAGTAPDVRAQTEAERQLSVAREELRRIGQELEEAERDADASEEALTDAVERLEQIEAVVNEVAAQVERQRVVVADAEERLAEVVAELEVLEAGFTDRVTRLFKQGPDLAFEAFLNAEGAEELLAGTELLERVIGGDQVDLERLAALQITVETQREIVRAEQARLQDQLADQELLLEEAEELRASRALAAEDARRQAARLQGEQDDLEADESDLAALVERQREERRAAERRAAEAAAEQAAAERREAERAAPAPAPEPAPSSGGGSGYAWPMCAPVTSEYGPRWGRMHRGIDLGASTGTAIRAINSGTVIFAGWQGGYGQLMLIEHPGGVVSAYAHQSRFAVGQGASVSRGQVIGYVGTTGNTTGPHLHLETRVGGNAVNPRQYLSGSPC